MMQRLRDYKPANGYKALIMRACLILQSFTLIEYSVAGPEHTIYERSLKIGTNDRDSEEYSLYLDRSYRFDSGFKINLLKCASRFALSPKQHHISPIESPYLGLIAVRVETPPGLEVEKLWDSCKHGLTAIQKTHSAQREVLWAEVNEDPAWLKEKKVSVHSQKRSGPGTTWGHQIAHNGSGRHPFDIKLQGRADYIGFDVEGIDVDLSEIDRKVLSQPPGATIDDLGRKFWNFPTPGLGQVVYVWDEGCDMSHNELKNVEFQDWIFLGLFPSDERTDSHLYHGTPMVGKVAGQYTGSSQFTEIVIVKSRDGRGASSSDTLIEGVVKIYDHIRSTNKHRNCVINTSFVGLGPAALAAFEELNRGVNVESFMKPFTALLEDLFQELTDLGNVILVTGAGNGSPETPIDTYPQRLALHTSIGKRVVVVGGYDITTGHNIYQTADYVKVWAPALYVNSAARRPHDILDNLFAAPPILPPTARQMERRVEFAAGTSLGIDDVISHMYKLAYPRVSSGPPVLYSGISISKWPETLRPQWYKDGKSPPLPPKLLPAIHIPGLSLDKENPTDLIRQTSTMSRDATALKTYVVTLSSTRHLVYTRVISHNGMPLKTIVVTSISMELLQTTKTISRSGAATGTLVITLTPTKTISIHGKPYKTQWARVVEARD
ncbi:hypothetical protein TWF281_003770 [Arthrobotrys megalospora]